MTTTIVSAMRLERRLEDVNAGDRLEIEIDQDDVELAAPNDLERLVPAPDEGDVVAVELEHARAPFAQRAVIVDHEDPNVGLDRRWNGERVATDARRWRRHIGWRVG